MNEQNKLIKLSIIVPVYNAEAHLKECIDSILASTLTEFELILVDDGSKDKSGEICDSYKTDSRVKVIHKENAGPSEARNTGINAATGEYIGFVDSDDFIDSNMFETLYRNAKENGSDIAFCNFIAQKKDTTKGIKTDLNGDKVYDRSDVESEILPYFFGYKDDETAHYKDFFPFADYTSYIFIAIFKTSMINENNIRFLNQKIYFNEDNLFNLCCVYHAKKVSHLEKYLYFYRDSDDSLSKTYNPNFFAAKLNRYKFMADYIKENNLPDEFSRRLQNKICVESINIINYYVNAKELKFKEKYQKIHEIVNRDVIKKAFENAPMKELSASKLKIYFSFEKHRAVPILFLLSDAYNLIRK